MSTALGLAMQISANTAQLAQAVADVNQKLDSMGEAGKKASADLGTLKNIEIGKLALGGLQAATSAFLSLTGAVTGAITSVTSFALSVGEELDALNDVANRTGVGVEALQAYARAAADTGVSVESFAKQIQKLTVNIGQASLDDKAQKKFEALGIVFEELKAATPEKQFEQVVDAISRIADPAERAATAVKFFGKGGIELGELFTLGPGALTQMREEAVSLGQVVSSDAVKAIDNMNDSFAAVYATVKGLTGAILGELAGPISTIAQTLLGVIQEAGPQQIAQQVAQGLLDFIQLAGNAFFQLAEFIEAFIKRFAPILGLDIRSEAEKELDKLRAKEGGTFSQGVGGVPQFVPGSLTPEEKTRLDELTIQVAAEASGGVLREFQANFNAAIDTATAALQQKIDQQAQDGGADPNSDKQTQLLEQINRNGQVGTVEILN
jgi:flagellar biosynthesis/type III secretory pathway protein FliH